MTKKEYYLHALADEGDRTAYLLENSGLPGPRANPELLTDAWHAALALQLLDRFTRLVSVVESRKCDAFRVLWKDLGYCWSVLVSANPECGIPAFEKLFELNDKDAAWVDTLSARSK